MKRWIILSYGIISYLIFLVIFLYSMAFVGNFLTPWTLDSAPRSTLGTAIAINLTLLTVFAVQHSLMARPFFKRWITRLIPEPAERSTYVMASNLAMILFFVFWQPIGPEIWNVTHPVASSLIYALFFAGWAVVFVATCLTSHFDLFGLRQVWLQFKGQPYTPLKFEKRGFYKSVRHPLYVGWLMVFWFTPMMSVSHLLFAVGCTAYILIAIQLEEKDLVDAIGVDYQRYKNEVPMLVPRFGRTSPEQPRTVNPARGKRVGSDSGVQ